MKLTIKQYKLMADAARALSLRAIAGAHSGHVGIALGAADILTAIFANKGPKDRFVLSAGHGSALLYSVLFLTGHKIDLSKFRTAELPGHPELGVDGVEATTGPLGQGVAMAIGMALAKKINNTKGKVYCLCSDGDLMEGVAQEALSFAGIHGLNNLILLFDDNGISIDGRAQTNFNLPNGWNTAAVDGHNFTQLNAAIGVDSDKPLFIKCKTIIGLRSSAEGTAAAHGLAVPEHELFELADKLYSDQGAALWQSAKRKMQSEKKSRNPKIGLRSLRFTNAPLSTREASGKILKHIAGLTGGTADLSESTRTHGIEYGVREHAMAAIMNGLALSGLRPYGGTFLVFSDYMRPAIRLSAMMKLPVIYVFTHDSIAVGEDGPTHQPVEQLASLRLIPNMVVLRPADFIETAAAWEIAIARADGPACLILSRQKLPCLCPHTDGGASEEARLSGTKRGAYIVRPCRNPKFTLIATGSEVSFAAEVAKKLNRAQVVSMPSVEIFRLQSSEYKNKILRGRVIAIEAGATAGWHEFADAVVGIDRFGESGSGERVYKDLGFDADAIAKEIKNLKKI